MRPTGMTSWLLGAATLALSGGALAQTQQIPPDRTIDHIFNYRTYAVIRYTPPLTSTLGCGAGAAANNHVVLSWETDPNMKFQFATMLTAHALKKKIGFGVNKCHPWGGGIPMMYRIESK